MNERGIRLVRFLLHLYLLLLTLVIFFAGISIYNQSKNSPQLPIAGSNDNVAVKIVVFTPKNLFGNQLSRTIDHVNKLNAGEGENCEKRCEWTMDRNLTLNADAVFFYFFSVGYNLNDLPMEFRRPNQIWAMHTIEAPPFNFCQLDKLNGIFNWTINYRKDSDIWSPYGRKIPNKLPSLPILIGNFTLDQWVTGKNALVTQVASNCKSHSNRELLVNRLKKAGLPIHVYGGCGKAFDNGTTNAWELTAKKYKFYLTFENSLCTDYITEKFWRSLELGMVPVVFGRGDYLDEAPPNSYIDVRSFSSAKELVQYLLKLDKEPEEYKKYFKWREDFTTVRGGVEWCKFCVALHQRKLNVTKVTKVYDKLDSWYWQRDPKTRLQTACKEKSYLFFKHV